MEKNLKKVQNALINHEIAQKQSLYNDLFTESRKNTFRNPLKNDILFFNLNSDNHGLKSWDKFTFVALFHSRQTNSHGRIHLNLFIPSPPPPPPSSSHLHCSVDTCTRYFSRVLTLYWGSGGLNENFWWNSKHCKLMFTKQN